VRLHIDEDDRTAQKVIMARTTPAAAGSRGRETLYLLCSAIIFIYVKSLCVGQLPQRDRAIP